MVRNIFKELEDTKDRKEKAKLLENFWLNEKRTQEEDIEIVRKGIKILETGSDKEKIIALQVISRTQGFPLSGYLKGLIKAEHRQMKTVEYEELIGVVNSCLEFLLSDNGNLRFAAANCLNYLKTNIDIFDSVELFYNLLSLKEFIGEEKKAKAIEFCLNKIYSSYLEMSIEASLPLAVKKMKINADQKNKEDAKELENFANNLIQETEKYIPEILKLRGENLLKENMIPYVINIEAFQISYEIQRVFELAAKKQLSDNLSDTYSKFRLSFILKQILEKTKDIEDKKEFICVDINLQKKQLYLTAFESIYERFNNTYQGLSKFSDWKILNE